MKYSPDNITKLEKNQVIIIGSNEKGIHGAGAAKYAHENFGLKWGVGNGLSGQTYALPTKDFNIETLSLEKIQKYIDEFIEFAKRHPELEFLVTAIGTGLGGLSVKQVAPLFPLNLPDNVLLPASFIDQIESDAQDRFYSESYNE